MNNIVFPFRVLFFLALALLVMFKGLSQETNYWSFNYGVISTLKGGIEVGGIRDVSAAYYNPAALAFIDGEYFEAQADLITMEKLDITNAAGDNINLDYFGLDVAPSIIGYMKRLKNNPRIAYSVGVLTRFSSNLSFSIGHEQEGNYLMPEEDTDVFQGQYRYDNKVRESWAYGSFAYRLSDAIAVGLATNLYVRGQDYLRSYSATAFPLEELDEVQRFSRLTSNYEEQKFNYRVMGFIFKPSVSMDFNELKLGMTVSTPALNLRLLNNFTNKSQLSFLPDLDNQIIKKSDTHVDYKGVYKTPWSVSLGAEYEMGKFKVAISGEWFSEIDKYEMITKGPNSIDLEYPTGDDEKYAIPVMAHKSITNVGISVYYEIEEWISYIGSFRTNFNYFDEDSLDRNQDFVPNLTYYDVDHLTSGIKLSSKRVKLTAGLDYGYGSSSGDSQFVSMTSATQENILKGDIENNTSTRYQSFGFTIGFNFNLQKTEDN